MVDALDSFKDIFEPFKLIDVVSFATGHEGVHGGGHFGGVM